MVGQLDGKSDQDLADIAAYFASQQPSGGQTKPELLELGDQVEVAIEVQVADLDVVEMRRAVAWPSASA